MINTHFLALLIFTASFTLHAELPAPLRAALERVEAGAGGPGEERVLRRYAGDAQVEVRLAARVGMSRALRGRGQAREALGWVEEYAAPTPENLAWPRVQGFAEAARVRMAMGQSYDAVTRLNRARETSAEGLARMAVLRVLSDISESQPDLAKALDFELLALEHGTRWFRRRRVEETGSRDWQAAKEGHETWLTWKPEIETRIAELRRRIRADQYGLDFVLYEEAQTLRKANHVNAMDFTDVAGVFRSRDPGLAPRVPGADFAAARARYEEIIRLFPEGVYSDASRLYGAVCLLHLGDGRRALNELMAFYRADPGGLYRGEALKLMGDVHLFAEGDRRNAREAYERAARWIETVKNQTRVLETYLAPAASRVLSTPPTAVRTLDRDGLLRTQAPPVHSLVNRVTAPWYLDALRAETEWKLAFLAALEGDAAKTRAHLDLALAHDPPLRRQVDAGALNAYSRILERVDAGKPLVGEAAELSGLREREALLIQWADMQFLLEHFDSARDLYRRIQTAAERADNGNAVARAALGESLLARAVQDPKRRESIPRLIDIAERYPRAPAAPYLLYRAALLSHGEPVPPAELFARVYTRYPNSPHAVRARYDELLRTIPWEEHARRRQAIDRFKRDFPQHKDYHDLLERHDRQVLELSSRN